MLDFKAMVGKEIINGNKIKFTNEIFKCMKV